MKKLSAVMKEMAETIIRVDSRQLPSAEAAHAALLLSNVAWNRSILKQMPDYSQTLEVFESSNPDFWKELQTSDPEELIARLVEYKQATYPDDRRQIHVCGMVPGGKVHVEWTQPDVH